MAKVNYFTTMKHVFLLATLCFAPFGFSENFNDSAEANALKKLLDSSDVSLAWHDVQRLSDAWLGEPEFDFYYGLAALKAKKAEYAVFAFERVVSNKPQWLDAQYLLAKAYLYNDNYRAAIQQCESLLTNKTIAPQLTSNTAQLLTLANNRLAQQAFSYRQQATLNIGYDSNVNAGSNEQSIFIPSIGNIDLFDTSQAISDSYLALNYQINASQVFSKRARLMFTTQIDAHQFKQQSEFNRIAAFSSLNYQYRFSQVDTELGISLQPLWLDGDYYRHDASLFAGVSKSLSSSWQLAAKLSVGTTNNHVNDYLDTKNYAGQVSAQYSLGSWRHSLGLARTELNSRQIASEHNSRTIHGINWQSMWLFSERWLATAALSWQRQEYAQPNPFFLVERADELWLLNSSVIYQASEQMAYQVTVNMQDKSSNIALFAYQRADISFSATLNF